MIWAIVGSLLVCLVAITDRNPLILLVLIPGAAIALGLVIKARFTYVAINEGVLRSRRIRLRELPTADIDNIAVFPLAYPGATRTLIPTAVLLNSSNQQLMVLPLRGWSDDDVLNFANACGHKPLNRLTDVLGPEEANGKWPGSFSSASRHTGYVTMAVTLAAVLLLAGGLTWLVLSVRK